MTQTPLPPDQGISDVKLHLSSMNNYFLVSTIGNAVGIVVGLAGVFVLGATTCGLGCLFLFLPLINVLAMVLDILAIQRLQLPPSPQNYDFLKTAAIVDIVAFFALIPMVTGILNLTTLGRKEVYDYFHTPQPTRS